MHHTSIPEMVMATGTLAPFSPYDAREDVRTQHVNYVTRVPVGLPVNAAQYSPPPGPADVKLPPDFPLTMFGEPDVDLLGDPLGAAAVRNQYIFGALTGAALGLVAGLAFGHRGERAKSAAKFGAVGVGSAAIAVAIANMK